MMSPFSYVQTVRSESLSGKTGNHFSLTTRHFSFECLAHPSPRWGEETMTVVVLSVFSPAGRRWRQPDEGDEAQKYARRVL
ncbi:hypothetical protein H4S14_001492 [Agrobacterium vitis]|nr:hypothetical protein [Agrobacterium vitis]MBE1437754.1 hypothetical protein [Agrobacterium vitis]